MALNTCEMWFNDIKIVIFIQKSPTASGGWGLCPRTPVCDTFDLHALLNTFPNLDIFPLRLAKSWLHAKSAHSFRSSTPMVMENEGLAN